VAATEPGHGIPERRRAGAQASRRARMCAAARALAAEGGSDAVTMHAVAARAGVARATLYRYFASKDHLLAEVTDAWAEEVARALRASPPRGTASQRVARALVRALAAARREPRLAAAMLASATSPQSEARHTQRGLAALVHEALAVAVEPGAPADRARLEILMGHVFFSALVQTTAGGIDHAEAVAAVETAAEIFFRAEASARAPG